MDIIEEMRQILGEVKFSTVLERYYAFRHLDKLALYIPKTRDSAEESSPSESQTPQPAKPLEYYTVSMIDVVDMMSQNAHYPEEAKVLTAVSARLRNNEKEIAKLKEALHYSEGTSGLSGIAKLRHTWRKTIERCGIAGDSERGMP